VTLAVVAVEPVLWRRMLMMLDMAPPVAVARSWQATVARSGTPMQPPVGVTLSVVDLRRSPWGTGRSGVRLYRLHGLPTAGR
jgi:hypothetical protein